MRPRLSSDIKRDSQRGLRPQATEDPIELSVIVAAEHWSAELQRTLRALTAQSWPGCELIVAAYGRAARVTPRELPTSETLPIRVVHSTETGKAMAINAAVEQAVGEICLFLDDDLIAEEGLLTRHCQAHQHKPARLVFGRSILLTQEAGLAHHVAEMHKARRAALNDGKRAPHITDCSGVSVSIRRSLILGDQGFSADLPGGELIELVYRLWRHGSELVYLDDAVTQRPYRRGDRAVAAELARSGIADVALYRRDPAILPHLRLGAFGQSPTTLRELVLRRWLLSLGIPHGSLLALGPAARRRAAAWYHFVEGYCYWYGVRAALREPDTLRRLMYGPVVLMYHAIGSAGEPAGTFIVPARRFARQMAWLKWRRYAVIRMDRWLEMRRRFELPPARAIVITFDDGYYDNFAAAFPILRRYAMPATIFLVSRLLGAVNRWDQEGELTGRRLLGADELRALSSGGIQFGAHTRTHASLTSVSRSSAEQEISGSRLDLELALGQPISLFAYPYGHLTDSVEDLVRQAGYSGAVCSHSGINDPVVTGHALRRIEVRGSDSWLDFVLNVWFGSRRALTRLWRTGT